MKTLVIGDLHNHVKQIGPLLKKVKHDHVIFLGDYFDNFNDTVDDAKRTAKFVKRMLDAGYDLCYGNHDLSYMFVNDAAYCPGFRPEKFEVIREILSFEDWQKMHLTVWHQNYLFSHAGAHPDIFTHPIDGVSVDYIEKKCAQALQQMQSNIETPQLGWGQDRGGDWPVGGIIWLDFHWFKPIPGLNQVVGHTPDQHVRKCFGDMSQNYCIDVFNGTRFYGVIENNNFETYPMP